MPVNALERRCQGVLENSALLRLEAQRVRKRCEALQRSCEALKADLDPLIKEMRAEVGRSAAVRQAGMRIVAQCADSLEAANSLVHAQRELEQDVRRWEVDRAMERLIEFLGVHGVSAFRSDCMPDLPVV